MSPRTRLLTATSLAMGMLAVLLGAMMGNHPPVVQAAGLSAAGITGLTIRDGNVTGDGGGIYSQGALRLESTQVISNSATDGGGLYISSGDVVTTDSQVLSNTASNYGGGLYVNLNSALLTMDGGQVRDNAATPRGGGLYVSQGHAVLNGTLVSGNTATRCPSRCWA